MSTIDHRLQSIGLRPAVINGLSDLIVEVFGADKVAQSRSAVGMAGLPLDIRVVIEGEIAIG